MLAKIISSAMDYSEYSPLFPNPVKCFSEIASTATNETINRFAILVTNITHHHTVTLTCTACIAFFHVILFQATMERVESMVARDMDYALYLCTRPSQWYILCNCPVSFSYSNSPLLGFSSVEGKRQALNYSYRTLNIVSSWITM